MKPQEELQFQCAIFEKVAARCGNDLIVLQRLGSIYSAMGQIQKGLHVDLHASFIAPDDPIVHYNLACSFALSKQPQFALDHLKLAINLGFEDFHWLKNDPDLASLRALPEFKKLFSR